MIARFRAWLARRREFKSAQWRRKNKVVMPAPRMNAVVRHRTNHQQDEPSAMLAVIERASKDPSVDIEKMRGLFAIAKEIRAERAEQEFNAAMVACQTEMRPVAADAENPQTRSKYASFAQLDKHLRPIYTKHGFALSYDEGDSPKPEHVRVLCYVSHTDGHTRTYRRDMPADGKGAKGGDVMTKTHAAGAAGSYGARYLLKGIFNVAIGEDDRDGNTGETISEQQIADLNALLTETGSDKQKFLKWARVNALGDILVSKYGECVRMVQAKRR